MSALTFLLHMMHGLAFIGLVATSLWRIKRTNSNTLDVIRLSIWLLFCASGVMLVMPVANDFWPDLCPTPYTPTWPVVAFAWAVLAVQFFTGRHWAHGGAPACYQKGCKP
jgi:hypothetical protein